MTCRFCGTDLPTGALFCAECGRAVTADQAAMAVLAGTPIPPSFVSSPAAAVAAVGAGVASGAAQGTGSGQGTGFSIADLAGESAETPMAPGSVAESVSSCPDCGATVTESDVFCGECGHVLRTADPLPAADAVAEPPNEQPGTGPATSIIVLPDLIRLAPSAEAGEFDADASPGSTDVTADALVDSTTDATTEVDPLPDPAAGPTGAPAPVAFGALDALATSGEPGYSESEEPEAADDEGDDEGDGDSADESVAASAPDAAADAESSTEATAEDGDTPVDELVHESPAHVAALAAAAAAAADVESDFDEPLPFALPTATPVPTTTRARPIPDPFPWGTERPVREDIEATRLISDMGTGTKFVLQFSTGESVTVLGSGLVGRNPAMQPGEFVDQLVPIFDAGKSVSKTHLEFGQEGGRFWVSDRYSTNGSTIRQPDAEPRRADPGRRYFVARGTRVDLGEQFFVVS